MNEIVIGYACVVLMVKMICERPDIQAPLSIESPEGGDEMALKSATERAQTTFPDYDVYGGGAIPIRLQTPPQATGATHG